MDGTAGMRSMNFSQGQLMRLHILLLVGWKIHGGAQWGYDYLYKYFIGFFIVSYGRRL